MHTFSVTPFSGYQSTLYVCGTQLQPWTSTATTSPSGNSANLQANVPAIRNLRRHKAARRLPGLKPSRTWTPTAGLASGSSSDTNFTEETPHTSTDGQQSPLS